jgi:uncharacterized alkaline shock family protein YloU
MPAISPDVLARYAGDAAREVDGVYGLAEDGLHRHKGVRIVGDGDAFSVVLHLVIDWGASIPAVGAAVQERVSTYLRQMAHVEADRVDVIVDAIGPR